jgi:hypothetical protein
MKLGIRHERITPSKPQQNGRHERMHLTLKQETASPPATNMRGQQRALDRFRVDYNDRRPHEALGNKVPAEFYTRSQRRLPEPYWGRDFSYDVEEFETVRVNKKGAFFWTDQQCVAVSLALKHQLLGVTWRSSPCDLYFGPLHLGAPERRAGRIRFVRAEPTRNPRR